MSRSYNEDWARKKAYLIRSLFEDIPYRALSPVIEESTQSVSTSVEEEPRSLDPTYLPSDPTEVSATTSAEADTELSSQTRVLTTASPGIDAEQVPRSYSPLPELIIEREPNRHDEPAEYYRTLLIKIRRIYQKMFVEGKNLSDEDFFDTEIEDNLMINNDIEFTKESSDCSESSNYSDMYSADYEFSGDELDAISCQSEIIDGADQELYTKPDGIGKSLSASKGSSLKSDEQEDSVNVREHSRDNSNEAQENTVEIEEELSVSGGDADYRQITIQAEVHIDGIPIAEVKPSPVYEEPLLTERTTPGLEEPKDIRPRESSADTLVLRYELSPPEDITREGEDQEPVGTDSDVMLDVPMREFARSPILTCSYQYLWKIGEEKQGSTSLSMIPEDTEDNGSPTQAEQQKEVITPSPMLGTRSANGPSSDDRSEVAILEDDQDPDTTPSTKNQSSSAASDHIEVMRTTRPHTSLGSNLVDVTRFTSDMDFTLNNSPRDFPNVSSHTQDGGRLDITADKTTSFEKDDILSTIFNRSTVSSNNEDIGDKTRYFSGKKRKYKEISVQKSANIVTWDDLRGNLFIGAPKIFKLCSCSGTQ